MKNRPEKGTNMINYSENMQEVFLQLEKLPEDYAIVRYMQGRNVVEVHKNNFWDEMKRISSVLIRLQLQGKHIGIIGKNSFEWIVCYCAVLNIGSVAVLFNKDYTKEEIEEYADLTDLSAILFDKETEDAVAESKLGDGVLRISMHMSNDEQMISLEREKRKTQVFIENHTKRDDLACIIFTSGTTGKCKAVMLPNRALITDFCYDVGLRGYDCKAQMAILPYHHLAGFSVAMNTICLGECLCIGEDPKRIIQYLNCMKPECVFVVPALLSVLEKRLHRAKEGEKPLGNLKVISCGGAKFQPDTLEMFLKWGIDIWQIYAASETCGQGIICKMKLDGLDKLGRPCDNIEADIKDGELIMRGDAIMLGYYKESKETEEVLHDGWYHTGDLCRKDDQGYYYLTGRKKNLIILSNGENISPEEIEERLMLCEDVCEVLVKEENDFICGEFYPSYPESSKEEVREAVRCRIQKFVQNYNCSVPSYKQIRIVKFRDCAFEKTSVGKIVRNQ